MLAIDFEGWFQCRLATDPDPSDEPRGASGFTFAMPGEPDLDRVLRFHRPVAPRSHAPEVGVFVRTVSVDGRPVDGHPLVGAPVELLGEPKFESRNYVLRDSSQGPIVPFHLRIAGAGLRVEREDVLYPPDPGRKLHHVPSAALERRGSHIPLTVDLLKIADATGIRDPGAYRRQRKALLEADLREERDATARAALEKRISELSIAGRERLQVVTLTVYNDYRFDVRGPATLVDPERRLGFEPALDRDWPLAFWMGAWDSDALCGFVRGMLSIPRVGEEP
ncbi:hypothetical protein [Pyxidicoccus caerfyrddinensis]|uniref:hypothetical protein n=1 Tax=Pyxidicoccus caerfyrddinensis TaxID=2709663 RepID=UPI0013DA5532|nr:hypothetical protein [Pyxidicoccus caerfyrddinensis]